MPSEPTRKPVDQNAADATIARRGPPVSTHVPKSAALMPSITIAIEKMIPIDVSDVSKWSTRDAL